MKNHEREETRAWPVDGAGREMTAEEQRAERMIRELRAEEEKYASIQESASKLMKAASSANISIARLGPGGAPTRATTLPSDATGRKNHPVASGVLDYFPDALVAIAEVSKLGNDQHNPGEPLHWARGKSADEADTMIRHFLERGSHDVDGLRHSAKMAWRALALLQKEIEAENGLAQAQYTSDTAYPVKAAEKLPYLCPQDGHDCYVCNSESLKTCYELAGKTDARRQAAEADPAQNQKSNPYMGTLNKGQGQR